MVYYKRVICAEENVGKVITELRRTRKYNYMSVYFLNHSKHRKYGLAKDKVLIIAHKTI